MNVPNWNNLLCAIGLMATVVAISLTRTAAQDEAPQPTAALPELRLPGDDDESKRAWRDDWPTAWHGHWDAIEVSEANERDTLVLELPEAAREDSDAPYRASFHTLEQARVRARLDGADAIITLPLDELRPEAQRTIAAYHNARAHDTPPEWRPGYAVRYKVRLADDLFTQPAQTVSVTLPTGGWLNEQGDDLAVVASDGTELPVVVLSHEAMGETTIQFRRYQYDTVYWVYAINPDAEPGDLVRFEKDPETLRAEAEEATLAMMAAQREAGELTGRRREMTVKVERERKTLQEAQRELDEWAELLPERKAEHEQATEALEQAKTAHAEATEAHEVPAQKAQTKSAAARKLTRAAQAARREAEQAREAHAQAEQTLTETRTAADQAEQTHREATERHDAAAAKVREAEHEVEDARAVAQRDDLSDAQRKEAEARLKRAEESLAEARELAKQTERNLVEAAEALEAAPPRVEAATEALEQAAGQVESKRAAAEAAQADTEPAEEAAREARLAAAPTANRLEEAEKTLRSARRRAERTGKLVEEAEQRIEELEQVKADAEAALAQLEPELEPIAEAADTAQQRARAAAADAERKQQRYRQLAYEADPRVFREGLTVEYRRWAGDTLGDWPEVVDGLRQSRTITDNAIVSATHQDRQAFRRAHPGNFAASYRGYLKIDEPGVYSFLVNAEDTVFLFINGYRVYSRTGTNKQFTGRVDTFALGADMQLEAGVHPLEVHHVVGNTLGITGSAYLLWIPPDEQSWSLVPRSAFTRSALGVPVALDAADGEPVAFFRAGVDDKFSADGLHLWLARFQAISHATEPDAETLAWTFEDGTRRTGRAVRHLFFEPGDTTVELKSHPDVPPFRRRVHVMDEPNPVGAHALRQAVDVIGGMALDQLPTPRLSEVYHYLRICAQPNRWPVMESVVRELLGREGLDLEYRVLLHGSLMRALAHQGHGTKVEGLLDEALALADGVRTLRAQAMLDAANVQRNVLRDLERADELYERIITENERLRHPIVREAAVAWGDLYLNAGDHPRAGEAYRLAQRLGRIGAGPAPDDATERGALLRVAEQQLKHDDVQQSLRVLDRIEQDHPEQKLSGLYRFLRAEADRHAGDYERAIRHYEAVTQLNEWASYHPHALRGIADAYYRMGEFQSALDWYAAIDQRHPRFYQQHNLESQTTLIQTRLDALQNQAAADANAEQGASSLFSSLDQRFEREAAQGSHPPPPTMGFDGPGTFMVRRDDGETALPSMTLRNLPSQGSIWIEFWYRTRLGDAGGDAYHRYGQVALRNGAGEVVEQEKVYLSRTFGAWRKAALEFEAPQSRDAEVVIHVRSGAAMMEVDAVRVNHISDGMRHARRRFLEGADPQ